MKKHPLLSLVGGYLLTSLVIVVIEGFWPGTYVAGQAQCRFGCGNIIDTVVPIVLFWPVSSLLDIVNGMFNQPLYLVQGLLYVSLAGLVARWWWTRIWRPMAS